MEPCGQPANLAPAIAGSNFVKQSKASAILGGQASRLELIARQQTEVPHPVIAKVATPVLARVDITPGSGGGCRRFVAGYAPSHKLGSSAPLVGPDDFLASKRLAVKRTSFDQSWSRVRGGKVSGGLLPDLRATSGTQTLAAVNAWTNDHVRYVEDRVLYGKADYWASAATTLQRRAGDCEDIAIAKMQLLARIGVPRSDMYLTIARDTVRNADHAMLVVKMDGHHWLLDNATNQLLDAEQSHDYRPILSFSTSRKWVHGY